MAWDWRVTAHTPGEESCLGSTPATATALSELPPPSVGHVASVQASPWRTAPSQTLLSPQPPTPACEGLPTAWSGCCGSRNTLAHCPVSSLGEKEEKALAAVLRRALPFQLTGNLSAAPFHLPGSFGKAGQTPHSFCVPELSQPGSASVQEVPGQRPALPLSCQASTGAVLSHTPSRDTHSVPPHGSTGAFPNCLHGLAPVHTRVSTHTLPVCTQAQNSSSTHPATPAHTPCLPGTLCAPHLLFLLHVLRHSPMLSPAPCRQGHLVTSLSPSGQCQPLAPSHSRTVGSSPQMMARTASIPGIPSILGTPTPQCCACPAGTGDRSLLLADGEGTPSKGSTTTLIKTLPLQTA